MMKVQRLSQAALFSVQGWEAEPRHHLCLLLLFFYNLLPKKHRLLSLLPNSRQEVYIFQENSKSNHFLCSYYPETSHSEPSRFMSQGKLPFLPHRPPGTCPSSQPSFKCEDLISRRRKEQ